MPSDQLSLTVIVMLIMIDSHEDSYSMNVISHLYGSSVVVVIYGYATRENVFLFWWRHLLSLAATHGRPRIGFLSSDWVFQRIDIHTQVRTSFMVFLRRDRSRFQWWISWCSFTCYWTSPVVRIHIAFVGYMLSAFRDAASDDAYEVIYHPRAVVMLFSQHVMFISTDWTPTMLCCV